MAFVAIDIGTLTVFRACFCVAREQECRGPVPPPPPPPPAPGQAVCPTAYAALTAERSRAMPTSERLVGRIIARV